MTTQQTERRIRSDARLHHLAPAMQEKIVEYCQTHTHAACVKWLKAVHNFHTNRNSLGAWLRQSDTETRFSKMLNGVKSAAEGADMIKKLLGDGTDIPQATVDVLGQKMFETLLSGDLDLMERLASLFVLLSKSVLKKERVRIERAHLELSRESIHLTKSQKALIHAPKIKTIVADSELVQQEKIDEVRKLLFGEEAL